MGEGIAELKQADAQMKAMFGNPGGAGGGGGAGQGMPGGMPGMPSPEESKSIYLFPFRMLARSR